jgi:c-di-GMP-binding flagellar brake protein YcgR
MVAPKETRLEARKILRCAAKILLKDASPINARTIDISMSGISLMLAAPVAVSQQCVVIFDAPVDGKIVKINLVAKAIYCTCVGTSGFRVGFQFDQRSEAVTKSIRQLLQ